MKPTRLMRPHLRLVFAFFATGRQAPSRPVLNAFSACRFGMDRSSKARLMSCRPSPIPGFRARHGGQALVEGIVVLVVLLSLSVAIAWLFRFQDMALQASHASRFAAFSLTRNPGARPIAQIRGDYFSGRDHQWKDRRGQSALSLDRSEVTLSIIRHPLLGPGAQPGGASARAQELRQGWRLEDAGIVKAAVMIAPKAALETTEPKSGSLNAGLGRFGWSYPALVRHTAILTDAGHASGDADSQRRLAESPPAWSNSANRSYELGGRIQSSVGALDRAWGRPPPRFDWLTLWAGAVPDRHLGEIQGGNN